MTGRLTLASLDPTSADHAVRKSYCDGTHGKVLVLSDLQNIPTSAYTQITWATETYDPEGWHGAGSGTITVPAGKAGMYAVCGRTTSAVSAGDIYAKLNITGYSHFLGHTNGDGSACVTAIVPLNVSDTITFDVSHPGGGNMDANLFIARFSF